ncbi:MAG: methyltransferase domain-containing protein [Phycisphaerae bacterium]|nr:methyltransferase domain-containing protein [Phycisphaerae bacterium]
MENWTADIEFERIGPLMRLVKKFIFNPLANHLPAQWWRTWLREGQSELALANWNDPGGWRSMVISYEGNPEKTWDRMLVKGGTVPMALRNRRRLTARLCARLIDQAGHDPAHAMCLGAGPGLTIMDAMQAAKKNSFATLVDISSDAFDYGQAEAKRRGLADRVKYIQADVRDVKQMLDRPVDLVELIGICEYLDDEHIVSIVQALGTMMDPGTAVVFNSISDRHGTDRFFRNVFGLHMHHRSPEQIEALLKPAGFGEFRHFPEPLGVYTVVVGTKSAARKGIA